MGSWVKMARKEGSGDKLLVCNSNCTPVLNSVPPKRFDFVGWSSLPRFVVWGFGCNHDIMKYRLTSNIGESAISLIDHYH